MREGIELYIRQFDNREDPNDDRWRISLITDGVEGPFYYIPLHRKDQSLEVTAREALDLLVSHQDSEVEPLVPKSDDYAGDEAGLWEQIKQTVL